MLCMRLPCTQACCSCDWQPATINSSQPGRNAAIKLPVCDPHGVCDGQRGKAQELGLGLFDSTPDLKAQLMGLLPRKQLPASANASRLESVSGEAGDPKAR